MFTPQMGNLVPPTVWWAADNGRFAAPEKYTDAGYFNWLDKKIRQFCIFATAPDSLGNHFETVALSRPVFPILRQMGFRPAFVAQDGWEEGSTPWAEFDCFFIGGTDKFKLGTGLYAARIANERRKFVHMGRVNSFKRLLLAEQNGCHSADGTFLKYGPEKNIYRMLHWFEKLNKVESRGLLRR